MKKVLRALLAVVIFGFGAPLILAFWGYTVAGQIGEKFHATGVRPQGGTRWMFLSAVAVFLLVSAVTWFGIYSAVVYFL